MDPHTALTPLPWLASLSDVLAHCLPLLPFDCNPLSLLLLPPLAGSLKKNTGRELPIDACPIRFGSWMGGDRDGNPNVTAKVCSRSQSVLPRVTHSHALPGTPLPCLIHLHPGATLLGWHTRVICQACCRCPDNLVRALPPAHLQTTHDVATLSRWMAADLYLKEVGAGGCGLDWMHGAQHWAGACNR